MRIGPDIHIERDPKTGKTGVYGGIAGRLTFEEMGNILSNVGQWFRQVFGRSGQPAADLEGPPPAPLRPGLRAVVPKRGGWGFTVYIDGDDLVLHDVRATCFGGSADPQDSGKTASGVPTKGNPSLMAASLPMDYNGANAAVRKALSGSPIPRMPFGLFRNGRANKADGCWVKVFHKGQLVLNVPVIDIGPAHGTGNALDLTIAAARVIDPKATATNFEATVDIGIPGGAKYLQ